MNEVKCRNCGAPMEYVTGIRHLKCPSCGSEFVLEGDNSLTSILYNGGPLFTAYIPEGWNYNIFPSGIDISRFETVCYGIAAWSLEAALLHFPRAFYQDHNSLDYTLDGATITNHHKYLPIDAYVYQRIHEIFPQAQGIMVKRVDLQLLQGMAVQFAAAASRNVSNPDFTQGKYEISFWLNGQQVHGFFGTILVFPKGQSQAGAPVSVPAAPQAASTAPTQLSGQTLAGFGTATAQQQPKIDVFMGAGMMGMSPLGGLLNAFKGQGASGGSVWGRAFDAVLLTQSERLDLFDGMFNDFALNVNYGPQYTALQQQEYAQAQNIQMQGAMMSQQNQIAASRRLSQTIAQRNDIIMSGYEQRTARMDHMMQQYTEANRGINTYTDNQGRTVEASVRFDHVYQNDRGDYIGAENNLNLGPDWQELKRNE